MGQPLFLPDGGVNEALAPLRLREYLYFTETRQPLPADPLSANPAFLGSVNGISYYLIRGSGQPGTLDHRFLTTIDRKDEAYVIYADRCLIDAEFLRRHAIQFKKIPRDIVRF